MLVSTEACTCTAAMPAVCVLIHATAKSPTVMQVAYLPQRFPSPGKLAHLILALFCLTKSSSLQPAFSVGDGGLPLLVRPLMTRISRDT